MGTHFAPKKELLSGVRVLDLASVGPAARASRWLADYGAEVVKVGPVPSRKGVQIEPPFFSYSAGRRLKKAQLDLKSADGKAAFLALAKNADVVIESFRPGVVDRLGIGYADVKAVNPGIVYCSTSGFGQSGPKSQQAGHDINYLAVSGFLACTTPGVDSIPPIPGATVADSAGGGMHAVTAVLAALFSRSQTGEGSFLDVSVADGVLALMSLTVDEHLATGATLEAGSSLLTGKYACYATYKTADGGFLAVGAIEHKFWLNLCAALGLEQWGPKQMDDASQDAIKDAFRTAFASKTRDEWVALLDGIDVCVSPVLSIPEVATDVQYAARGAVTTAEHPEKGGFQQTAPLLAGMVKHEGPYAIPDGTTATDELLSAAGYSTKQIDELRESGAVA